jgi:hypothetical protein
VVDVVLELYPHLPLSWLVPNEGVLQQLLRVRPLVIVFDQHSLNEAVELLGPFFRPQPGRRIPGNQEKGSHGMQVAEGWLGLCHLQGSDAQRPQIRPIVVGGVRVLLAGNDFGSHPIRGANEGISPANCTIQLSTDTKVDCIK